MASLSVGIVGLPNVGKSTLFNALCDANALAANYPFATIEPNTGVVPIPDERLQKLAQIYNTDKIVPATVTFTDIAGLIAGASKGEGLGNQFLAHIRSCNAICQVVRVFEEGDVQRAGSAGPQQDIETINTELVLADLQTLDNRLPRMQKEAKADPRLKPALEVLQKTKAGLDEGKLAGSFLGATELEDLRDLQLLTAKPFIIVFNMSESQLADTELQKQMESLVAPCPAVFLSAKLESELRGLDKPDRQELLASYGQSEEGLGQLIHAAYAALGLQSFLTAGEKEVRAWTIPAGATAPQAAGVIHGDFERGFIAAQVVSYKDLVETGSLAVAKAAGKVRTEDRDYVMQPDDVVEFRFNV